MTERRRIKILHFQLLPLLSGVQRVSLEELRRLDPHVFDRHLLTCQLGPFTDAAQQLGVTCHFEPSLKRSIVPWNDYRAYRRIIDLMRRERFDLVHTHSSKPGVVGRLAAHAAGGIKIVHTVHGFAFPASKHALMRQVFRWCETRCGRVTDALICLNPEDQKMAIETLKVPAARVHRVANGVDTTEFAPIDDPPHRLAQRRARLAIDDDRPMVIMVARLWPQKNPLAFVRAAIDQLDRGSPATFCIVGDGGLRDEMTAQIDQAGWTERIRLLGWRDDVAQLLPLADVFVLPSRWEGMPLVLLEAHACGVPVVASDIPGNRQCVQHDVDGFLVPLDDQAGLADAIDRLVRSPELRQRMGGAGRDKILQRFEITTRHDAMLRLYGDLLGVAVNSPESTAPRTIHHAGGSRASGPAAAKMT